MTFFQSHEWWVTRAGDGKEEFDVGCLCVANIDNEPNGNKKIIVGSHMGFLRIYYPRSRNFKIEDLVFEKNLELPVLQLAAGRFVAGTQELSLAVLHPHCLIVYVVSALVLHEDAAAFAKNSAEENVVEFLTSASPCTHLCYELTPAYSHVIPCPSFNMCYGPFGHSSRLNGRQTCEETQGSSRSAFSARVHEKDHLCIQSLDGILYFFEQNNFSFTRILSNSFLFPGPLVYSQKHDVFITCNAQRDVETYTYGSFVNAVTEETDLYKSFSQNAQQEKKFEKFQFFHPQQQPLHRNTKENTAILSDSQIATRTPGPRPKWRTQIGELGRHIELTASEIVVIGEHTLFLLSDQGIIQLQKRMVDYPITAAVCYPVPHPSSKNTNLHNLLATSTTGHVLVFQKTKLLLAAKLAPSLGCVVQVVVSEVSTRMGMILALDDKGTVAVMYLGIASSPLNFVHANVNKIDCETLEKDHHFLLQEIAKKEGKQQMVIKEEKSSPSSDSTQQFHTSQKSTFELSSSYPILFSAKILDSFSSNDENCSITHLMLGDHNFLSSSDQFDIILLSVDVQLENGYFGNFPANSCATSSRNATSQISDCVMFVESSNTAVIPMIEPRRIPLPSLSNQGHETVNISVYMLSNVVCSSLLLMFSLSFFFAEFVDAHHSYSSVDPRPGNVLWQFELPFRLVSKCIRRSQMKIDSSAVAFQLLFQSSHALPCLQNLFQDLTIQEVSSEEEKSQGIMVEEIVSLALELHVSLIEILEILEIQCNSQTQIAAVVLSPNGYFLCVMASHFASLSFFTRELLTRLSDFFKSQTVPGRRKIGCNLVKPFRLNLTHSFPLEEYFQIVEKFSSCQNRGIQLHTQLANLSYQYQVCQKQCFKRFKNQTPSSLNHFDTLLNLTYERLMETCDKHFEWNREFQNAAQTLRTGTELLFLLIQSQVELDNRNLSILRASLNLDVAIEETNVFQEKEGDGWLMASVKLLEYWGSIHSAEKSQEQTCSSLPEFSQRQSTLSSSLDTATQRFKNALTEVIAMLTRGERFVKQ